MIVGIFGDSFAEPRPLGWTSILENKHHLLVKNYAQGCTTVFWSYCNLQTYINDIDVIVFVLTSAHRLHHPDDRYHAVCNFYTATTRLKDNLLSHKDREIFKAAEQYHLYLSDVTYNNFVQGQLLKEIKLLAEKHNKSLIIVPAFPDTVEYQLVFEMSLYNITETELFTNFGKYDYIEECFETRANHMSLENNEILALKIVELINGKQEKISLNDFIFKKYDDPSLYWKI